MNIQWYPGHMTKTRRQMAEYIKQVDAVCEVVDARIPQVSRNPDMDEIAALARQLREVVLQSLHVFSLPLFCLYVPTECMNDYHIPPEIYNDVTSQVLRNGEWQLAEHIRPGELIPVQIIYEVPAPSEEAA